MARPILVCGLLQLKDDAVALVDVLAPTDFILNSPLGQADGQVNAPHKLALPSCIQ